MRPWFSAAVITCLALGACPSNSADKNTDPAALTANAYLGVCDGSAAIAMPDGKGFMVAADDSNVLLAYMNATTPALSRDVGVELGLKVKKKSGTTGEIDIEGAARIGAVTYWIGSHGTKKDGKVDLNRRILFATTGEKVAGASLDLTLKGAYRSLVEDLAASPDLASLDLAKLATLAPEEGGLNIEGLAATPSGGLLLGLRSPVVQGKALVVSLDNPSEAIAGSPSKIGAPQWLDLGGRGIRDMTYSDLHKAYFIVAGPADGKGKFDLYKWSGAGELELLADKLPKGFRPEAMLVESLTTIRFLSDDGDDPMGGADRCKDASVGAQRFRYFEVTL